MSDITHNTADNAGQILTDERIAEIADATGMMAKSDVLSGLDGGLFCIDFARAIEAEQAAKIADLKRTIEWLQGQAGQMMGAAAGASLAATPAPTEQAELNPWRTLFGQVAFALNCLPSSFVDGNDHVVKKAEKLAAQQAPDSRDAECQQALGDEEDRDRADEGWFFSPNDD